VFRDECEIEVVAGKGGDGLVSFRREKFLPKGGPDGGDGGNGGDVILLATDRVTSLLAIGRRRRYAASDGRPGGSNDRSGARGEDVVIEVPVGTQVFDRERGNLLKDLARIDERLVIAAGGRGGRGNARFANAVRQAPHRAEPGRAGEERSVRLELKLIAEVGLVGLPNAGKSTLLSAISEARPKIADYPFTTLVPHVGIAAVGPYESLVVADLPGLIEGAAQGAGLGHRFLKHVERCKVLLHLIDVSEGASAPPEDALRILEAELEQYSSELARRPRILVATKCEDATSRARAEDLRRIAERSVLAISAATGEGVPALLQEAYRAVRGRASAQAGATDHR
jgi:GTP-binding protein